MYDPEIMRRELAPGSPALDHYFYGCTEEVLSRLRAGTLELNPNLSIVGSHSPPFRPLTPDETDEVSILQSGADVVWVGLVMPRQELWMHEVRHRLPNTTLIGVGAAFDFIAGTKPQAPAWMRDRGLEWAYRLAREPRRMWRRYIWNNPAFLVLLLGERLRRALK